MLGLELSEDARPNESNICTRDKTRQAPAESPANTIEEGATGAWKAPGGGEIRVRYACRTSSSAAGYGFCGASL